MPGMDGTGPVGTDPFGRGLGPCAGGYPGAGFGRRMRRGKRFGWVCIPAPFSPEEENLFLEQRKARLESQLAAINAQIEKANNPE